MEPGHAPFKHIVDSCFNPHPSEMTDGTRATARSLSLSRSFNPHPSEMTDGTRFAQCMHMATYGFNPHPSEMTDGTGKMTPGTVME